MTCKDCIHNDICSKKYNHMYENYYILDVVNIESVCKSFKDKSKFIELPSDAEPVVHGHWIEKSDGAELQLVCEKCGYDYIEADPDCIERHNFCPNCGAKMDEGG